jgi:hypothetical protein
MTAAERAIAARERRAAKRERMRALMASPEGDLIRAARWGTPKPKSPEEERRARRKASRQKYRSSPKGKAAQARYDQSPKGRARRRRYTQSDAWVARELRILAEEEAESAAGVKG